MTAATAPNCWVLVYPSGERAGIDGEAHFASEAFAANSVGHYTRPEQGKPSPTRLPAACVTISCVCCETTFDEDGECVEHHESIELARKAAAGCGWRIAADGTPTCEDCKDGKCDCAADLPAPPAVVEVHPAQAALPLGEEK